MNGPARRIALVSLVVLAFAAVAPRAAAQVSLTTLGVAYTQSFDTLPASGSATWTDNTTIPGWYHARTGTGTTIVANDGASNAGNLYSYGTGTNAERALGSLGSGNTAVGNLFWGVRLQNNTGSAISSLEVSYTGEQWRNSAAVAQTVAFSYLVGSPTVAGGLAEFQSAGTAVASLDFTSPITGGTAGALNGNLAANRTVISFTITGLSIPNGTEVMLRWSDPDHAGADHGLSIDDFSVTPVGAGPVTPALSINDVSAPEGNAGTTTFSFTVSLSVPAGAGGVTFDIATADNTATVADNDYVARSLTGQTIAEGGSTYTFDVMVNGDTTVEPNETFFVNVTNVTGANLADGQGVGTIENDDVVLTMIHTIQGSGTASPLVGQVVTTTGIVTGRKFNNGFFIQTPDADVDADPATSEGIFVFTSSAPPAAAAVGNLVEVTGTVVEYVPSQDPYQPPLTELISPTVSLISTGNPLPAPIVLTSTNPDPAGPYDQLERYEGMRVSVPSMTVVGPTLGSVSEVNATATSNGVFYGVVTGVARPFREAGIRPPDPAPEGTIPPIPRWDGNPEMLRVDADGQIGATTFNVGAGAVVTNVVGPLDYSFRYYTILPDPATPPVPSGGPAGVAVATPLGSEFTVASYNLQRFFDDVNDPAIGEPVLTPTAFANRLAKASLGIRDFLTAPDVLGVVEVENLSTLQALATRINNDAVAAAQPDPLYVAYLVEGLDVGGIDVGFLVKTAEVAAGTPRVEVLEVVQELAGSVLTNPDSSTSPLNDRPPLRLNAVVHHPGGASFPVTVIVNHLRSLNGVDDPAPGSNGWTTAGARVRAKRLAQANDLANLVQTRQTADPTERIILIGDFNAFEVNDGLVHAMATLAGTPVPDDQTAVPGDGVDLVNPDLVNLVDLVPAAARYGYVYDGSAQNLDHTLVNAAVVSSTLARRVEHPRINADFPQTARNDTATAFRLSDHDPVVGFFQIAVFASAGITTTMTDAPDPVYPGAGLTYSITVTNGGPDAATGLTLTDALPAGTTFASLSSPAGWTCTTPAVGANGTVSCTAATLAALANAAFTLSVTVDAGLAPGTILTNTASVTHTSTEATPGDESATVTTTVQTPPLVYATKSVSGVAYPGGPLTYTIVLYNNGSTPQLDNPGDELVDVLPASLTLVSASATSGTAVATVATNTVTWNGSIPAGGSVTVTILAQVGSGAVLGDVISNQATVWYDANGDGTNESSTLSDDPATGTLGDATAITVSLGAGGVAVIPTAGTVGLGLLALLVALGGALLVGRRLA